MAIEYLGLSQINGPLVVLEGVQNASFEEIVEITVNGNEKKLGRIIELYEDKAVIQVFEGKIPIQNSPDTPWRWLFPRISWDVPSTVSESPSTDWERSRQSAV